MCLVCTILKYSKDIFFLPFLDRDSLERQESGERERGRQVAKVHRSDLKAGLSSHTAFGRLCTH